MTFRPQWVKDLAAEVPEAPEWLVHHLLPRGRLALLAAYPKVGKSTFATQLAIAVAQGRDFLGRPTYQGGVLYVNAEERRDDLMGRLRNFGMNDADSICLWTETAKDTPEDQALINNFIRENNITLVIIDTFATYLMIQDETNNSQVTARLKPYLDMAHSTGAAILFIHHERKNSDGGNDDGRAIRGGGAILAMTGVALQLQRESGGGTRRHLGISSQYSEIPRVLKLDYKDDEYVCLGTPEESSRATQRDKAIAVLPPAKPGLTVAETAKKAEMSLRATRTALERAYVARMAERAGAGRKGDPFRYNRKNDGAPISAQAA
jgi:hypothetical protein